MWVFCRMISENRRSKLCLKYRRKFVQTNVNVVVCLYLGMETYHNSLYSQWIYLMGLEYGVLLIPRHLSSTCL